MTSMATNPNHIEMVESVRVRSKQYFLYFPIKCISHRKVWYLFPQVSIHDKEDQTTVRECICWDFLLFYVSIIIFIPDHGITFPNIYLQTFQGANKLKIFFTRKLGVLMIRAEMWPNVKNFFGQTWFLINQIENRYCGLGSSQVPQLYCILPK